MNDTLYAILNLKDVYAEQIFSISPIGFASRKDITSTYYTKEGVILNKKNGKIVQPLKIKFEISEVYKGNKYEDTAITEIYFDGLDVY